ncbi:MAG TPA: hypothetical protein VG898_03840 [Solirubrobacterales bacterium]|nr:hypothetical protein [Solirubrobacterales bacterium]
MIERLRDALAPRRSMSSEEGYRRLLRWAAVPVTDKRWAAPLAAIALGFGIFAGVAIGPSATGTLATAPYQLIEMPSLASSDGDEGEAEEEFEAGDGGEVASFGGGEEAGGFEEEATTSFAPVVEEAAFEPEEEAPLEKTPAPLKEEGGDEAEGEELAGTVVHVNKPAGSYTVAEAGGLMSAVHAGKLPPVGAVVEVPIRALANGTLAEAGRRVKGKTVKAVELAGIVTFVNPDPLGPAYTVSNRGTSALVHIAPDPSGAPPELPTLGAYATVKAGVAGGRLTQAQISGGGAPFTHVELEGIVGAVEAETAQLLLSADDIRESGLDIALSVPAGIDVTSLVAGDSVLASADIGADGTLTLTGLASDERLEGAEDAKATQGDLVPEKEGAKK